MLGCVGCGRDGGVDRRDRDRALLCEAELAQFREDDARTRILAGDVAEDQVAARLPCSAREVDDVDGARLPFEQSTNARGDGGWRDHPQGGSSADRVFSLASALRERFAAGCRDPPGRSGAWGRTSPWQMFSTCGAYRNANRCSY